MRGYTYLWRLAAVDKDEEEASAAVRREGFIGREVPAGLIIPFTRIAAICLLREREARIYSVVV